MRSSLKLLCILLPAWYCTLVVAEESIIEIHVVDQNQYVQFPGVQIYTLAFWEDSVLENYNFAGIDSNYFKFYGWSEVGQDTEWSDNPAKWVKASNMQLGDWWYGSWSDYETYEEAVQDTIWMLGFTPYQTKEVEVTPIGWLQPMGSKWFSDGTGLMGFHFEEQGGISDIKILAKNVIGGYGNWPLAIGNWWRYLEIGVQSQDSFIAPQAFIALDGQMSDWVALDTAIVDPQGDDPSIYDGCDIKNVYVAVNPSVTTLYLMANFWDGAPNPLWGQQSYNAYQFHLHCEGPDSGQSISAYYQGGSWNISTYNMSVPSAVLAVGTVVEFGIPLSELGLSPGDEIYAYGLQIGDGSNNYDYAGNIRVILPNPFGVIEPNQEILPDRIALLQNSPNPFNASTTIRFQLPAAEQVTLNVYDTAGRLVTTLVDGFLSRGEHKATFEGSELASGVYLYRLEAGANTATGKMVLLR